jgi:hypothetical protein
MEKNLEKEKSELYGTFYNDFVKGVFKNSIYKSIQLHHIENNTAYYECEPYDEAYKTSENNFYDTCEKLDRAFKKYYKNVFAKYDVENISVEIYNEYSCVAGLSVDNTGTVTRSNF